MKLDSLLSQASLDELLFLDGEGGLWLLDDGLGCELIPLSRDELLSLLDSMFEEELLLKFFFGGLEA